MGISGSHRLDGGYRGLNCAGDQANRRTVGGGEHQDRDAAAAQVLLLTEVRVCGDRQLIGPGHDVTVQ